MENEYTESIFRIDHGDMKGGGRDTVNLEGNLPFGARDWKGAVDSRYCSIIIKLQFLSTHSYFCIFF